MKLFSSKKIIFVALIGVFFLSFSFKSKFFEIAKQIEIYNTLFKELNMFYVDEINPAEFTNKAIKNTLKDLDPYTNFYTEQDVENAKIRREGEYGGIGVSVSYTKRGIEINEVYKGFSADKAGLKIGDIIVAVDGQSIVNLDKSQLSAFLKGTPNTSFTAQIKRRTKLLTKEITREKIVINPVPFSKMIDETTGYIVLTRFNNKASSEVKKAFKKLKAEGMTKLVFDLRYNPGGSLLESINISNFFLPKDRVIVTTKAKVKKWSNVYKTKNTPLDLEIPIVVLVNERSASASEIVSGSLQDYDRAVIMGQRSFGKGLVQRYRELAYGTQLKLTISKYYTPSGRCIQELDYTNRTKEGKVPKFSDGEVHAFKTANGRTVYDGGGVLPDVVLDKSVKTEETKTLLRSKAIFNYATDYYYKYPNKENITSFNFKDSDFSDFISYLKTDTTFVTKQEKMFDDAYELAKLESVSKEFDKIKDKLYLSKIDKLTDNKDVIETLIKEEVVKRYAYEEGVYSNKLKTDKAIKEAVKLLGDSVKYKSLLFVK